jgi:hypothetical protein
MNSHVIIALQDIVHSSSLWVLGVVALTALANIFKPSLFQKFMFEFGERKYVVSTCAFIGLLFGTIFIATQPNMPNTFVSENTKQTVSVVDITQTPTPELTASQPVEEAKPVQETATPNSAPSVAVAETPTTDPKPAKDETTKTNSKPSANPKTSRNSMLPKIELSCKKDTNSGKNSRFTICLYRN